MTTWVVLGGMALLVVVLALWCNRVLGGRDE